MYYPQKRLLIGVAAAALLWAAPAAHAQFPAAASRVTASSTGGPAAGGSRAPSVSEDGRFIAYVSDAANLVSGDTNENSDVFVHDKVTGATERVSLSWKGQEARGDSSCPSISAGGRYVAFRSWAWNLYAGGSNLGTTRWDVYLRDRQLGTTTRLTVGHDGSEPDNFSMCPSISADGRRVVFESVALNLLPDSPGPNYEGAPDVYLWDATDGISLLTRSVDGDESRAYGAAPSISGDGNVVAFESGSRALIESPPQAGNIAQIYVLDLSTGEITHESRSDSGRPGNRPSRAPKLSHDGRYVTFLSGSVTLVEPLPGGQRAIGLYVRDRVADTTVLASPARGGLECGPSDARFPCRMDSVTTHSLSGDGRYAAFATRGTNLLPGSDHKGDQIYVFDRVTGRLRRAGIDDSGTMGDGCSVEPALSGDGDVVAFRTNSTNLAPGTARGRRDVVKSDWRCLDGGECRVPSSCPTAPQVCEPASRARLVLLKNPPSGQRADSFMFRWQAEPVAENFPDPTAGAEYQFCLYSGDQRVVEFDVALPTEGWRARSKEFRIRNGGSGLSVVTLRNGDARSRITLKGKGALLDAPYLPIIAPQGFTAQLIDTDSGRCFGADFPVSSITRNHPGDPSSRLGRVGRFAAKLP